MGQAFQDLRVWQKAIGMCLAVYRVTKKFPEDERYGLTSQLRRAAVSVASNIAESRGRLTDGEFRQFLGMAQGSNFEVQTQLVIGRELRLAELEELSEAEALSLETRRMLSSLIGATSAERKLLGKAR